MNSEHERPTPMKPWISALAMGMAVAGCSRSEQDAGRQLAAPKAADKPAVAVVNYPLAYFAERLSGGAVRVVFPAPPDSDPAHWQPSDDDIAAYQTADVILLNGAGYGQWLQTATLPVDRMVDTSREFADSYLQQEQVVTHSHGPDGLHEHGGMDFNTWLDPLQAIQQARAVGDALQHVIPEAQPSVSARFAELSEDLMALDASLAVASRSIGSRPLLASHPVYNYLARRYGWNLRSVHWDPDEAPLEAEWPELRELLRSHPARLMLWEDDPLPETVRGLGDLGITCVIFRPCGNRPGDGDYLSEMRANVTRLKRAAVSAP